jgi:SAM-dependent methyltransferase
LSFSLNPTSRQRCEQLIQQLQAEKISVATTRHITEELGEDLARLVLSSAELQTKAISKLGDGPWWVTQRSLQQATPAPVAHLKATWFGEGRVYDLCCGLGGDAIHLGKKHNVIAVDRDPHVCLMINENTLCRELQDIQIRNDDVMSLELSADDWVHIDPDRRAADRRNSDPAQYSPAWADVQQLLANVRGGSVKLAPAADSVDLARPDVHRIWVSLGGEVREQSLLFGEAVRLFRLATHTTSLSNPRSAVIIDRDQSVSYFCPRGQIQKTVGTANQPEATMVDPSAAIRAAGLTETFANQFGLKTLGKSSGFLTGDVSSSELGRLAISERVLWHGSCDDRKLRRELRALDCYPWRVKTRGVSQDPNQLEKKLRDCGSQPCTLWIGMNGKRRYAVLSSKAN